MPPLAGIIETNPRSVGVRSRCGTIALPHVRPPSREMDRFTSFACIPGPLFVSQCAASEPSGNARMEEPNRFSPCVIVRGADHLPPLDLTANFSAYPFGWTGSNQLREPRPSGPPLKLGSLLPAPAGESISRAALFSIALVASTAPVAAGFSPPPVANTTSNTNASLYVVLLIMFVL